MDEARLAVIIAAIRALKPEDFTRSGSPKMDALKTVVPDVTAEERDEAWAKIQAEPAANSPSAENADEPPKERTIVTGDDVVKSLREKGHAI